MLKLKEMPKFKVTVKKPDIGSCRFPLETKDSGPCEQRINNKVGFSRIKNCGSYMPDIEDRPVNDNPKPKSSILGRKRGPEGVIEVNGGKRLKMDRCMMRKCSSILKGLMTHPSGWIFNNPVDPVALGIPDYFAIISEPMDLGTIKSKIDKEEYSSVDDFSADVRLTFSNCMRYNPPGNWFHAQAVKLNKLFDEQLKLMDAMRKNPITMEKEERVLTSSTHSNILPAKRRIFNSDVDKKCVDKKDGGCQRTQHTLSTPAGVPPSKVDTLPKSSSLVIGKINPKCSTKGCSEAKKPPVVFAICHSPSEVNKCDTISCAMDRSICDEHTSNEEVSCSISTLPASSVPSFKDCMPRAVDIQLSPKRGIRTAMLKHRFADIIIKAEQKTLLLPGNDADSVKMRREKERLARKLSEEKARYEAEIKASIQREEQQRKRQRQQQRDASRRALAKIQKTMDWNDDFLIIKDIESLVHTTRRPLEKLGLFLKPQYMPGDVDDDVLL